MIAASAVVLQALDLARSGLPVFACDERKRPVTRHGFKDASRADRAIRAMFANPRAKLIGVPTGTVTGTVVVDIDVKDGAAGAAWLADHAALLPRTRTHRTPSGGRHLVYRYPPATPTFARALVWWRPVSISEPMVATRAGRQPAAT